MFMLSRAARLKGVNATVRDLQASRYAEMRASLMLGSSAIQNFCYYHGTNYSYTVTTSVRGPVEDSQSVHVPGVVRIVSPYVSKLEWKLYEWAIHS